MVGARKGQSNMSSVEYLAETRELSVTRKNPALAAGLKLCIKHSTRFRRSFISLLLLEDCRPTHICRLCTQLIRISTKTIKAYEL